jgi:hypothetical protein
MDNNENVSAHSHYPLTCRQYKESLNENPVTYGQGLAAGFSTAFICFLPRRSTP